MGLSSGRMDRLGPPAPSWTHLGSENDNFLINDEYKKKKKKKLLQLLLPGIIKEW